MKVEINKINFIDVNYMATTEFRERMENTLALEKARKAFEGNKELKDSIRGSKIDIYI